VSYLPVNKNNGNKHVSYLPAKKNNGNKHVSYLPVKKTMGIIYQLKNNGNKHVSYLPVKKRHMFIPIVFLTGRYDTYLFPLFF
jgi:hypothetical protein